MDLVAWLLSADLGREKLALLLFCTLVGYVLTANLVWRLFFAPQGASWRGSIPLSTRWPWIWEWVIQGGRLIYYVGVPYVVFARGALVQPAGIPTTWVGSGSNVLWRLYASDETLAYIGTAAAMWIGGVCLFVAVWIWYARVNAGDVESRAIPWWQALREAVFLQMLWAFYRGVISAQTTNAIYITFVVMILISVSWFLSPLRQEDINNPSRGYGVVRDWMLALLTAAAATSVRSLWLLVMMHWMWLWTSDRVLQLVTPSQS
jgi:hypothetical protein